MAGNLILVISILCITPVLQAQNEDIKEAAVAEHNRFRNIHGTPDLSGNETLHNVAQSYADYLGSTDLFEHSNGPYGENLYKYWGPAITPVQAVRDAIASWYSEIDLYDFNNPGNQPGTGHFTAMIWRSTTQVGIGVVTFPDPVYRTRTTVVANYWPPGNIVTADGRFYRENVPPPISNEVAK